jgi:hypothetical protein
MWSLRRLRLDRAAALLGVAAFVLLAAPVGARASGFSLLTSEGPLTAGAPIEAVAGDVSGEGEPFSVGCSNETAYGSLTSVSAGGAKLTFETSVLSGCLLRGPGYEPGTDVYVEAEGLPWTLKLSKKGTAKLAGTKKLVYAVKPANKSFTCKYEAKPLAGAIAQPSGELVVEFHKAPLKSAKTNSPLDCPVLATTSATYRFATTGEQLVEVSL